jgi:predicted RNase H-like nuclease (RuvC/YqgF family)
MIYKNSYNSLIPLRLKKVGLILFLIFLAHWTIVNSLNAQSSDQKLRITYKNDLLAISAEDADLQNVLLKLADKTNIYVSFPASLEKKVTIIISGISLRDALKRLLKGLSYAVIYSGPDKNQTSISKVFVFKKSKTSTQASGGETRIADIIRTYERQIESLKKNLLNVDENSRQGKSYQRNIMVLEKRIERLKRQYN